MTSDEWHTHSIEAVHPDYGQYEIHCRVINETDYHVEIDRSTFPSDDPASRMDCIDHASELLQQNDSENRILVDEDEL